MSKFSRRKPTSKRSEPILPGCHHPPPPPVKSRSFAEMRKQAVESQRKKFEEEPLEESFYAQNHLLALMDEACRIMDSQPSEDEVFYSSIESQYEYDVQLEQTRQCDFSFETEDLPPCPDFKLESFLPPVFLSTARKKTFDNMVQRIKTEPRIHNLIQEKLTSLSKHPGRFQDTYGSQGNDKTYVSCDPGSFFFRDIAQHDSDPDLNFQPSKYKDHYLYSTDIVFRNLIDFDERKIKVPPEFKSLIRFFFIPSSGGKSSFKALRNKSERYYDSDDLVRDNYPFFLQVKRYGDIIGDRGILSLFWKISFHIMYPVIYDKIILFNHPNQIPYPYLSTFNSFVILPLSFRYGDKFFNQNYYSLLCYDFYSLGISISFLEYSDYFDFIRDRVLNGRNSKLFDSLTIRP